MLTIAGLAALISAGAVVLAIAIFAVWRRNRALPSGTAARLEPASQSADARAALVRELGEAQCRAADAAALRPYGTLFDAMATPIQRLLGIAALRREPVPAWAAPDRLLEGLRDDITRPMGSALRRMGALQEGGKTVFPQVPKAVLPADFAQRVQDWSEDALRRGIAEARAAESDAQAWALQKQIVLSLDGLYGQLSILSQKEQYDPEAVARLARSVQQALETSGIYPLFCDDPQLAPCPGLRERFVQVSGLHYPGLFRKRDGRLEQFGMYSGTCGEEAL